jgi:ubiquinone/menaquinone biosynthesis C-methylase UbiE
LEVLGFTRIQGVDLSPRLVRQYKGSAPCLVGDCRQLAFADHSKDILIVQGGLHHLLVLPDDLQCAFAEMHRVLRSNGRVVFVEPWLTPFLRFAHELAHTVMVRRISTKLDVLAIMIEHERLTYAQWLNHPELILELSRTYFKPVYERFKWGKWNFVGVPR